MKKMLTLIALVLVIESKAQDKKPIIGSTMVTFSSTSNVEYSKESMENIQHLFFSDTKEQGIALTNILIKSDSRSEGKIYNVTSYKSHENTVIHYEMDWHYANNYNTITGIAKVQLVIQEIEDVDYSHWCKITITDDKGLDLLYAGPFFYYVIPMAFQYILEEKTEKNE